MTTKPASPRKGKLSGWATFFLFLGFAVVVSTIKVLVDPDREFGKVPAPVEGADIHWYERKNEDYVLEERRHITLVEPGYVTMTRPDGESLRVPRVKYDRSARE